MIEVPSRKQGGASGEEAIGTSRLHVTVAARVERERAADVLGPGRDAWLGELVDPAPEPDGSARYLLDLELRVSDAAPRVAFHKAAYLDVGPVREEDDGALYLEIGWRAAGLTPLFPVFAGRLTWTGGQLLLDGHYAPPGGSVGVVADRLLLNVAARGTGRRLLERIAQEMARSG
ncbi:MAG TPA: hypothetical protein VF071_04745 [Candidatus Limnocylindria bacterium]